MALISEPGLGGGLERWVKEGDQVGHFVIHEIRRGVVVARSGDRLQEMTVEPVKAERGLVRGTRTVEPKLNAKQDTGKDG